MIQTQKFHGYISKGFLRSKTFSFLHQQTTLHSKKPQPSTNQTSRQNQILHKHFLHQLPITKRKIYDYEEFKFMYNHTQETLLSYCHFARNDPYHQCFSVKVTKHTWVQNAYCPSCEAYRQAQQAATAGQR